MPADDKFEASRIVFAPEETIYSAMTDPEQLALWVAPRGAAIRFDKFDLRPGGGYRLFLNPGHEGGDTPKNIDAYAIRARYVDMIRDQRITQLVEVENAPPHLNGPMRVIWSLEDHATGTCVRIQVKGLPSGTDDADMMDELEGSLERLASLVERMPSASIVFTEAGAQSC